MKGDIPPEKWTVYSTKQRINLVYSKKKRKNQIFRIRRNSILIIFMQNEIFVEITNGMFIFFIRHRNMWILTNRNIWYNEWSTRMQCPYVHLALFCYYHTVLFLWKYQIAQKYQHIKAYLFKWDGNGSTYCYNIIMNKYILVVTPWRWMNDSLHFK